MRQRPGSMWAMRRCFTSIWTDSNTSMIRLAMRRATQCWCMRHPCSSPTSATAVSSRGLEETNSSCSAPCVMMSAKRRRLPTALSNRCANPFITTGINVVSASASELQSTMDRKILQQSLLDFEAWSAEKIGIPRVSVNVSARRLRDEELLKGLRDLHIRKGTVSFELVESIFLDDNDDLVTWNVEQIKQLGIDIEIDD